MYNKYSKIPNRVAKEIEFGEETRKLILSGVEKFANTVSVTFGPKGGEVEVESISGARKLSRDGLTVAQNIQLDDTINMSGARLVKEAAIATHAATGDGATRTIVLACSMLKEGFEAIANGANPLEIRRGMTMAVEAAQKSLESRARMISTSEEILKVGTISANGEREFGELIAKAMKEAGEKGHVLVQAWKELFTEVESVRGLKIDTGYISPHFVTDQTNQTCELNDPVVIICDRILTRIDPILQAIKFSEKRGKSLLLAVRDVEDHVLARLILKNKRGFKLCIILAPSSGVHRRYILQDLAAYTGGKVMLNQLAMVYENATSGMMGWCQKVIVSKNETVVLDKFDDKLEEMWIKKGKAINKRLTQLFFCFTICDEQSIMAHERYRRLSGRITLIKVGGSDEIDFKERKYRVMNALKATKTALEEGIVPGGGAALLHASKELDKLSAANIDQIIGVHIIQNALKV